MLPAMQRAICFLQWRCMRFEADLPLTAAPIAANESPPSRHRVPMPSFEITRRSIDQFCATISSSQMCLPAAGLDTFVHQRFASEKGSSGGASTSSTKSKLT